MDKSRFTLYRRDEENEYRDWGNYDKLDKAAVRLRDMIREDEEAGEVDTYKYFIYDCRLNKKYMYDFDKADVREIGCPKKASGEKLYTVAAPEGTLESEIRGLIRLAILAARALEPDAGASTVSAAYDITTRTVILQPSELSFRVSLILFAWFSQSKTRTTVMYQSLKGRGEQ